MIESQRHSYHLVDPSPWPISGSLGALATTVGGVMYMHSFQGGATLLSLGLIFILYTMFVWWRDVLRESTLEGHHTKVVQLGPQYGSISFIVSEVMFLFAFFRASSHSSLAPTVEIGGIWPPKGIGVLDPREIPFLNTPILLSSGAAVTWAHHAILAGKEKRAVYALVATVSLALVFTGFQGMEYYQAPFTISDSIYGSTFFLATGFHGFHVIIGTLFLIICGIRQYLGQMTKEHHVGFEAAAWYWHFVDVVRLFPFVFIYWWGGCSGRLALVLFFAVKAVNGTLFKDFFSCMEEAGPSSGASSSNPGNPVVPPIDQGLHGEVKQDEFWGVWTHLREFGEFPIPTPKESTVLQPAVLETPRDGGPFTRGATPQASPQQTSPSLVEGSAKVATNEAAAGCAQACSEGLIQRAAHCPDCFWDCVAGSCCLFCS
ncbi:unnamed protein product [Vicia faba]|uniref:Cytochrome c oxidase subunit 3 n=1 Tax=Vicia faba TaxID=3906 RepID=A0AAV0Z8K5_VICFA|nr:unnamed protein product [Vicia faba]